MTETAYSSESSSRSVPVHISQEASSNELFCEGVRLPLLVNGAMDGFPSLSDI